MGVLIWQLHSIPIYFMLSLYYVNDDLMAIMTKTEINKLISEKKLSIRPLKNDQIGAGSIDLHLGNELRLFDEMDKIFDVTDTPNYSGFSRLVKLNAKEGFVLEPGEFVNGITLERIKLSKGLAGRIEGRSRFARLGLLVHVSSGFVQPGTDGRIVLEIVNLSRNRLRLKPGIRICQIIIEEARGDDSYKGKFYGQKSP